MARSTRFTVWDSLCHCPSPSLRMTSQHSPSLPPPTQALHCPPAPSSLLQGCSHLHAGPKPAKALQVWGNLGGRLRWHTRATTCASTPHGPPLLAQGLPERRLPYAIVQARGQGGQEPCDFPVLKSGRAGQDQQGVAWGCACHPLGPRQDSSLAAGACARVPVCVHLG